MWRLFGKPNKRAFRRCRVRAVFGTIFLSILLGIVSGLVVFCRSALHGVVIHCLRYPTASAAFPDYGVPEVGVCYTFSERN